MSELSGNVRKLKQKNDFFYFDQFLIEKMLGRNYDVEEITTQIRNQAYRTCVAAMGEDKVAAVQTMQKWFGIHGRTVPSRETMFHLGFALHLTMEEVREYLIRGLHEPDFQVNDYREVLFMYGYTNQLTYAHVLELIQKFESMLEPELELQQHNHTDDMMEEYQINCHLPENEFLEWMSDSAEDFKGYSKTVLDYFRLYKEEILLGIKEEAEQDLEELLSQTTYAQWEKSRFHKGFRKNGHADKKRNIQKYINVELRRDNGCISEDMEKRFKEVLEMAFLSVESNQELLAELYASLNSKVRNYKTNNLKDTSKKRIPLNVNLMSDKYISDLLNISIHKERQIHLSVIQNYLTRCEEDTPLPSWMEERLRIYKYDGDMEDRELLEQWLAKKLGEQKRRCNVLKRSDLLPLILCVAQHRHFIRENKKENTNIAAAKKEFVELANHTLSACHMELLQPERYELDAVLMMCYQKDDIHYFADVLEELVK